MMSEAGLIGECNVNEFCILVMLVKFCHSFILITQWAMPQR
jgi:hypothetical protein